MKLTPRECRLIAKLLRREAAAILEYVEICEDELPLKREWPWMKRDRKKAAEMRALAKRISASFR